MRVSSALEAGTVSAHRDTASSRFKPLQTASSRCTGGKSDLHALEAAILDLHKIANLAFSVVEVSIMGAPEASSAKSAKVMRNDH